MIHLIIMAFHGYSRVGSQRTERKGDTANNLYHGSPNLRHVSTLLSINNDTFQIMIIAVATA